MKTRLYPAMALLFFVLICTVEVSGSSLSNGPETEPATLPTGITSGTHNPGGQPAPSTSACSVDNLILTPLACDSDGKGYEFSFEGTDFGLNGYTLTNNLGWSQTFDLNDFKIIFIPADCLQELEFTIYDNDNNTCSDTYTFEPECCECGFQFSLIELTQCEGGTFDMVFRFHWYLGSCGLFYEDRVFTINGQVYEYEYLSGLNYIVRDIAETDEELVVTMTFPLPIGESQSFTVINPCPGECQINNFEIFTNDESCSGEYQRLYFNFDAQNFGNEGYTITSNTGLTFDFEEGDQMFFDVFSDCADEYVFTLQDNLNPDCIATFEYGPACCPCEAFYNIHEESPCVNGSFDAVHEFDYVNGSCFGSEWTLKINDSIYPFTWLNDEYFRIEDISFPDSVLTYEFCATSPVEACFSFEAPNPCYPTQNDCSLVFEEIVGTRVCQNDSISLTLIIVGQNLSFQGFDVYVNDTFYTWLNYESDSLYSLVIPDPGNEVFHLTICNNLNQNCCFERVIENPCYTPNNDCSVVFEGLGTPVCDGDHVNLSLILFGQNISQTGYDVYINDSVQVFLPYEQDSVYALTLTDPGTETFTLTICDNDHPNCCHTRTFENPCYLPEDDCSVFFERVGPAVCDSNYVLMNLFISGHDLSMTGFDVFLNGSIVTFLPYEGDSIYQVVLPDPGTPYYNLTICDNDRPDCCRTREMANPCYEPNIDCQVVFEELGDVVCNQDSVFMDLILFGQNISETGFDVYLNGTFLTFFHYQADSLYELEFPNPEGPEFVITICDNDHPECCRERSFENPCFDPSDICHIVFEETSDLICENGQIVTSLIIIGQNTSMTGYDVFVNDSLVMFLPYDPDSIYQLTVPDPGTEEFIMTVCDHGNSACCRGRSFLNPCAPQGRCSLDDMDSRAGILALDTMLLEFNYTLTGSCEGPQNVTLYVGENVPVQMLVFEQYIRHTTQKFDTPTIPVKVCFAESPDTCVSMILNNPFTTGVQTETEAPVWFGWSDGTFTVVNQGQAIQNLMLYDNTGRMIFGTQDIQKEFSVTLPGIPSGLYHILYIRNEKLYQRKVMNWRF